MLEACIFFNHKRMTRLSDKPGISVKRFGQELTLTATQQLDNIAKNSANVPCTADGVPRFTDKASGFLCTNHPDELFG